MTLAAVRQGVLSCAARVQQLTSFIGFGPQAGAHLMAAPVQPDQRLFAMQIELPAGAAGNSFVDMDFAPNQANGCGASYQAISYWAQGCEVVASTYFAALRKLPALKRDVILLDGGALTKVFLMKAGEQGCISIKKEIVN